jgi:hypothetical protein
VRKLTVLGILLMASILLSENHVFAVSFEAHPGIYTAYEYTDNYQGAVDNEQSDNIYYIGPSLELSCISPTTRLDLTGRYTKSFHQRFSEDDSPDIYLMSNASYTATRQTASLSYEFERTLSRESLDEPFGEVIRNIGSIDYSAELTQSTRMNAGGYFLTENWSTTATTGEDLVDTRGNVGITHQMSQLDTISLSALREYYRYEFSPDVTSTESELSIAHAFSPGFRLRPGALYRHDYNDRNSKEDRYDATLTGEYTIDQTTNVSITGGYSWVIMDLEQQNRESDYIARIALDKNLQNDQFHLSITKEYEAEFTSSQYGTYDTRTASLSWLRQWVQAWSSSADLNVSKRIPVTGISGETETVSSAHVGLTWRPIEYFTGSIHYDHLRTKYEISGLALENRYRLVMEARY